MDPKQNPVPTSPEPSPQTETEAAARLARAGLAPHLIEVKRPDGADSSQLLVVPAGATALSVKKYLDEHLEYPRRKRGKSAHVTLASFVEHVNRHKDASSVIFADGAKSAPKLVAIYDYNEGGDGLPRWGEHRAEYLFPLAEEWAAWTRLAAQEANVSQASFAELIEDRLADLADPSEAGERTAAIARELGVTIGSPSSMLLLSRGLTINVDKRFTSTQNLQTGEGTLLLAEEHRGADGGQIRVPGAFLLKIPVFRGGTVYRIPVRLRYRLASGGINWKIMLHRSELVFQDAFEDACKAAREQTSLPLFLGTPEEKGT